MPNDRTYPNSGLHGHVVYQIGRQIVSGQIAVGSDLPREVELQERFGTSRQAIREAIKVLAAKGLIEPRRRRGTRVRPRDTWNLLDPDILMWHAPDGFGPAFLADLLELRSTIEPAAAELAARRGDAARIAELGAAIEDMRLAGRDPAKFYDADIRFHIGLLLASGNSLFAQLATSVRAALTASFRLQEQIGGPQENGHAIHAAVYHAIVAGDTARARAAMAFVIEAAAIELRPVMAPASDPQTGNQSELRVLSDIY